jgi:Acyl-CoA reductase (LuxC)
MQVDLLAPEQRSADVADLLARLRTAPDLRPCDPRTLDFCAIFSKRLFATPRSRAHSELQALAYWMRPAALTRLAAEFAALATTDTVLAPRGMAFHITPANVDSVFVYSWLLSMLAGNRNVVRIASSISPQAGTILQACREAFAEAHPAVAKSTAILTYAHDQDTTAAFSAVCDVRVIWGGDATIQAIRAVPLPPHARELTFADRNSLAAIHARAYLTADRKTRTDLASKLYADIYSFDQMACSSPRLMVWCGTEAECRAAAGDLFTLVGQSTDARNYDLPSGVRLNRLVFSHRAILDGPVLECEQFAADLVVLRLSTLEGLDRAHCGGGLLFQYYAESIAEIVSYVSRREQTLAHFGFDRRQLLELAGALNGHGVDRMVPIGTALRFNRYWDGYDLLQEMSRRIYIET